MIADAIRKINDGMVGLGEKRVPAAPIAKFLLSRLENDEELAAFVNQDHKTLQKCFDFVHEQALKHLDKKNGWIDDDEVYQMAVDYYFADDAELERQKAEKAAQDKIESDKRMEESRVRAAERTAEFEAEKSRKAIEKKQAPGQICMFSAFGGDEGGDDDENSEQSLVEAA